MSMRDLFKERPDPDYKSVSPVVERLPTHAKWHGPDDDDPTSIEHLPSSGAHLLGDRDTTEVEHRDA